MVVPYMLEASRVTHRFRGEMNFHIFYVLRDALAAASGAAARSKVGEPEFWGPPELWPAWTELAAHALLGGLGQSPYLAAAAEGPDVPTEASKGLPLPEVPSGVGRAEEVVASMRAVGLQDEEVLACMRVVLAVMLLGNISPSAVQARGGHAPDDGGKAPAAAALRAVAQLLEVPTPELRSFLGAKTMEAPGCGGDHFVQPRTPREVQTLRDSVARELYAALFTWLVRRVAAAAAAPPRPGAGGSDAAEAEAEAARGGAAAGAPAAAAPPALAQVSGQYKLAMLDIYGFEVCHINGLEQLLINYCNERLQALFNAQLFAAEARDYELEGLPQELFASMCQTRDLPALPLLEGGSDSRWRTPGLFALVDDEARCRFNEGSDTALRSRMDASLAGCVAYKACRDASSFAVAHFAGDVAYDSKSFVESNANAARPEILSFLQGATGSKFLAAVLGTRFEGQEAAAWQKQQEQQQGRGRRRQLFGRTVIQAFRAELDKLIRAFQAEGTQCHYVRCLKPNVGLQPKQFDSAAMLRQCRYSGLLETVHIRQYGFPHRQPILSFVERYAAVLWPAGLAAKWGRIPLPDLKDLPASDLHAWAADMTSLAQARCKSPAGEMFVGQTKVFMRSTASVRLEARMRECGCAARRLQARARGRLQRRRFAATRRAVLRIQAAIRDFLTRKVARCLRGVTRLQALFRGSRVRRSMQSLRQALQELRARQSAAATVIQRAYRAVAVALRGRRRAPPPRRPLPTLLQMRPKEEREKPAAQACRPLLPPGAARKPRQPEDGSPEAVVLVGLGAGSEANSVVAEYEARQAQWDAQAMQHQVQMEAVQAQFEALREYRLKMLQELNSKKPSSVGGSMRMKPGTALPQQGAAGSPSKTRTLAGRARAVAATAPVVASPRGRELSASPRVRHQSQWPAPTPRRACSASPAPSGSRSCTSILAGGAVVACAGSTASGARGAGSQPVRTLCEDGAAGGARPEPWSASAARRQGCPETWFEPIVASSPSPRLPALAASLCAGSGVGSPLTGGGSGARSAQGSPRLQCRGVARLQASTRSSFPRSSARHDSLTHDLLSRCGKLSDMQSRLLQEPGPEQEAGRELREREMWPSSCGVSPGSLAWVLQTPPSALPGQRPAGARGPPGTPGVPKRPSPTHSLAGTPPAGVASPAVPETPPPKRPAAPPPPFAPPAGGAALGPLPGARQPRAALGACSVAGRRAALRPRPQGGGAAG